MLVFKLILPQYLEETLSPMWTEMLLFDQILIEGSKEELKNDPPLIIINIYDFDSFVSLGLVLLLKMPHKDRENCAGGF